MRTGKLGDGVELLETALGRLAIHRITDVPGVEHLPYSYKVILENLLRHNEEQGAAAGDIDALVDANLRPHEIGFHPSRVFLHDTNGVPVLTDLAALRDAVVRRGGDPMTVDSVIPAHLTVDHSLVTDFFARPDAVTLNIQREYERNGERYRFIKWGQQAFNGLKVVPPGAGIMHQINVEFLADVITVQDGIAYPDTVAGTDSHTTMVNGLSVLAWGVGGIEAEAAMLGQPVSMLIPPMLGVELQGELNSGVTATDLVLTITERLRAHGVVGKFVEFFGPGVAATSIATRCTIANMSPEFGSTAAIFPIDRLTLDFLRLTGRAEKHIDVVERYAKEQGLWHDPHHRPAFDEVVVVDLSEITPSVAGPRRPQDRVELPEVPETVRRELKKGGWDHASREEPTPRIQSPGAVPGDGAVAIASITSCTNTSNPAVMVAAGLLARSAVERGLRTMPWVKTSLAPGSRVVTDYLDRAGLLAYLEKLGFGLVGYGCTTCIGNSGSLIPEVAELVHRDGLVAASVTSGNRNFDGRINNDVAMNFLASPPLVVAYALAGSVNRDLVNEPLGHDAKGSPVFLRDLWPTDAEVERVIHDAIEPQMYSRAYATIFEGDVHWKSLLAPTGATFSWDPDSTYLRRPPFADPSSGAGETTPNGQHTIEDAQVLLLLGDSVTTDHICPAGRIPDDSPAGHYLSERGIAPRDFNSYASRRGNWEVMKLGGFTNRRLRNRLAPGAAGGYTAQFGPSGMGGTIDHIHTVAERYRSTGTPLLVIAGKEYGSGSSRDWAAKVTALLGVRAVIAQTFERIHRSNLVGMGVLPLEFMPGESAETLALDGSESFTITISQPDLRARHGAAQAAAKVTARHPSKVSVTQFSAVVRIDTAREWAYYQAGGLLPFVLSNVLPPEEVL